MMSEEVVHGTEGVSGGVPLKGARSGRGGKACGGGGAAARGSDQSIYMWRRQELIDRGELPGLSSEEREELRVARRRIREIETELAVYRRAAELLKESLRPKGGSRRSPRWPVRGCRSRSPVGC